MLAATLKEHLERRGEGARMLQLQLFRVDGAVSRIALGTSRPLREPRLVQRLFHERLTALESDIDAGYGFDLVRLSVLAAARFEIGPGRPCGRRSSTARRTSRFWPTASARGSASRRSCGRLRCRATCPSARSPPSPFARPMR